MTMGSIALGVVMCVAAVFGFLCAAYLLIELLCGSAVCVAVRLEDEAARQRLDLLLREAKDAFGGRRELLVLLPRRLLPLTVEELALTDRYGAQLCIVEEETPPAEAKQ